MSKLSGRLRIIKKLSSDFDGVSLSIGSKETRFANINVDIDRNVHPDIVADVCFLPFKSRKFEFIFFTDVIEHLSSANEEVALKEIHRVSKKEGMLLLTTPHDRILFTMLDIARYIVTHRHYKVEYIKSLIDECNFESEIIFTAGGVYECIRNLWYYFITYPIKKIFKTELPYAPSLLQDLSDEEYDKRTYGGYTIFCLARCKQTL